VSNFTLADKQQSPYRDSELMLNRGSGLALDGGVPIRVALEGESVLAENKSGLAVRLAQRGLDCFLFRPFSFETRARSHSQRTYRRRGVLAQRYPREGPSKRP
jgi:hypothetical protein